MVDCSRAAAGGARARAGVPRLPRLLRAQAGSRAPSHRFPSPRRPSGLRSGVVGEPSCAELNPGGGKRVLYGGPASAPGRRPLGTVANVVCDTGDQLPGHTPILRPESWKPGRSGVGGFGPVSDRGFRRLRCEGPDWEPVKEAGSGASFDCTPSPRGPSLGDELTQIAGTFQCAERCGRRK